MYATFLASVVGLIVSAIAQQQVVSVQNVDATGNQLGAGSQLQTNVTNQQATLTTETSVAQHTNCSNGCPPHWMTILDGFLMARGMPPVLQASSPLCAFSRSQTALFSACSSPQGSVCKTNPVNFLCCPLECLATIKDCYDGRPTASLCVPTDLQPWMQKIMSMVLSNMGHFGASG